MRVTSLVPLPPRPCFSAGAMYLATGPLPLVSVDSQGVVGETPGTYETACGPDYYRQRTSDLPGSVSR